MSASDTTRHDAAKRRALRAARAVTISFAALAATGCASMVSPLETDATHIADANAPEAITHDAATVVDAHDAPPQDTAEAGHACTTDAGWEEYSRCCDENGWDWNLGCAAWGPFVPPEMNESEV